MLTSFLQNIFICLPFYFYDGNAGGTLLQIIVQNEGNIGTLSKHHQQVKKEEDESALMLQEFKCK